MAVHLSDEAEADLEEIWLESAAERGVYHAERVLRRFDRLFDLLDEFPGVGLVYPGVSDGVLYFPVRTYPFSVFFTRIPEGIRIVRILPEKMRVKGRL